MIDSMLKPIVPRDDDEPVSKLRVLVATANIFNGDAIKRMLQQSAIESDMVYDGREVVALIERRFKMERTTYELIVLDFDLHPLDGIGVAIYLRKFFSHQKVMKVYQNPHICLLLPDDDINLSRKDLDKLGVNSILIKPVFKQSVQKLLQDCQMISS